MKRRYLEKVAVVPVDPVTIPDEQFTSECLPPVEATDLLSYLVLETSFYTKQQFKAYKILEAYNFMVSGFITSVQGCVVREKHIVTGKVRHNFTANERSFNFNLGHCRQRWHSKFSALFRMQSRAGGVMFPRSKRVVLYRSLDKNPWKIVLTQLECAHI